MTVATTPSLTDAVDLAAALHADADGWRAELPQISDWLATFGDKLPALLWTELDTLTHRLK